MTGGAIIGSGVTVLAAESGDGNSNGKVKTRGWRHDGFNPDNRQIGGAGRRAYEGKKIRGDVDLGPSRGGGKPEARRRKALEKPPPRLLRQKSKSYDELERLERQPLGYQKHVGISGDFERMRKRESLRSQSAEDLPHADSSGDEGAGADDPEMALVAFQRGKQQQRRARFSSIEPPGVFEDAGGLRLSKEESSGGWARRLDGTGLAPQLDFLRADREVRGAARRCARPLPRPVGCACVHVCMCACLRVCVCVCARARMCVCVHARCPRRLGGACRVEHSLYSPLKADAISGGRERASLWSG